MRKNHLYRIDRTDVSEDIPLDASIDEQLEYCKRNIIRINGRFGAYWRIQCRNGVTPGIRNNSLVIYVRIMVKK